MGEIEKIFETTAPDFRLSMFEINENDGAGFTPLTAEILLLTEGKATIKSGAHLVKLEKGHPAAIVFPGADVELTTASEAVIYRATVPVNSGE